MSFRQFSTFYRVSYEGLMTRVVLNPNLCLANSIRQRTVQYGEAEVPEPPDSRHKMKTLQKEQHPGFQRGPPP